jgi:hypothetical protein
MSRFPAKTEMVSCVGQYTWARPFRRVPAKEDTVLIVPPGMVLYDRLSEHASSIQEAKSLDLADFSCRYLIVDDVWIPLGESLLIERFSPLWNLVIDGFGNHDPGSGRYNQRRSRWDTLHPGRSWAGKCKPHSLSKSQIEAEVRQFLEHSGE